MLSLNVSGLLRKAGEGLKKKASGGWAATSEALKKASARTKEAFTSSPAVTGAALTIGLAGIGGVAYAGYQWTKPEGQWGLDATLPKGASPTMGSGGSYWSPQGFRPPYY
ncbi:hypothetical protein [Vampirovibrio chlorellavorus]|uniref:hypothetical protein n=1 Tax=Vampirovibrio chlorellavorus TaxID=758823 RepID=UPI0026E92CED|nr:hypothetical protein [Vampirovibrio chlorellavorus]